MVGTVLEVMRAGLVSRVCCRADRTLPGWLESGKSGATSLRRLQQVAVASVWGERRSRCHILDVVKAVLYRCCSIAYSVNVNGV